MYHSFSFVENSPSPPCGGKLPGMFPVILWAHALADSQVLNQHVTTAGCRWESCLPCCLCFAILLVGTGTLRFPSCGIRECQNSVTPAPLLALCHLSFAAQLGKCLMGLCLAPVVGDSHSLTLVWCPVYMGTEGKF